MDDNYLERKRYFNIRILFVIFVGLIIGILLCNRLFSSLYYNRSTWIFWTVASVLSVVLMFATIIYFINKKYHYPNNSFVDIVSRNYKNVLTFVIAIIIGVAIFCPYVNLQEKREGYNGSGEIVATIVDIKEYDYSTQLVLDNITIDNVSLIGKGTIFLTLYSASNLTIGDGIIFDGDVASTIDSGESDLYATSKSYLYNVTIKDNSSLQKSNSHNLYQKFYAPRFAIIEHFKSILLENMSKDNAELTYSMIFGDKSTLPNDIVSVFRGVGVIHLLCVSGLHVGILVALVYGIIKWLSKKFGWGYKSTSISIISVVSIFLLFYGYLCGFGVSVIRASIMAMVLLISKILGKKYDILNSISLAGIVILLLMPYQIFEVGFQLSFLCVFAIITLVPKLLEITDYVKLPRWLATPFAISICVNIMIMPVLINTFGEASWLSIFANVIIVPLFGVVFTLSFYTMLIALFPFLSFVLSLSDIALQVLVRIVELFDSIPFGVVRCFRIGYLVVAFLILLALVLKYFMASITTKSFVAGIISAVIVLLTVIGLLPVNLNNSLAVINSYGNYNTIVFNAQENILVGSPNKYTYKYVNDMRTHIDSAILYDITPNNIHKVSNYCNDIGLSTVYIPECMREYNSLINVKSKVVYFSEPLTFGDFVIELCYNYIGELSFVNLYTDIFNAAYSSSNWDSKDLSYILTNYPNVFDCIIIPEAPNLTDYGISCDEIICSSNNDKSIYARILKDNNYYIMEGLG